MGEIRIQFHVVTDGHDQMIAPIEAFLETMNAYGQDPTELLTTDKPAEDKAFFTTIIPSLKATQDKLDQVAPPAPPNVDALPACDVDPALCKLCRTPLEIATQVDAARNVVNALPPRLRVMSLDAEWDVTKNQQGMVVGSGPVAVIQLSFKESADGPIRALVLQVSHCTPKWWPPVSLLAITCPLQITTTLHLYPHPHSRFTARSHCLSASWRCWRTLRLP